ncbi:MAG: glucose-1-phosphate thymidylyltransferase [Patescibacteria group bacterium]
MKALLTGGGRATRLRPITETINKHLIPLANKFMIVHAIEKVKRAGITDIIINTNPGETSLPEYLGDGSTWGVQITYREQQGGPQGVAHIPTCARDLLEGEPFLFYLSDNIILGEINRFVDDYKNNERNAMLAFSRVKDPQRFGVPEFNADGKLVRVVEKPEVPASDFAVTGIYIYDGNYFKAFDSLQKSSRGEYEISDVHTWYLEQGHNVGWDEITGWWKDTGKAEDLLEGNQLLLNEVTSHEVFNHATIGERVQIQGRVQIGKGTQIGDNVLIRGPVTIGENVVLRDSYIGPYTSIGDNVQIYNTELENSIILDHAHITSGVRIVDSLIGKNVVISASHDTLPNGHKLIVGDNSMVEL